MEERIIPQWKTPTVFASSALPSSFENQQESLPSAQWHVRCEFTLVPGISHEFDLTEAVEIGTSAETGSRIDLSPFGAREAGVSRRHVRLEPEADGLRIVDLGSTNGTRVNDRALAARVPQMLYDGDLIQLGSLEFIIRFQPLTQSDGVSDQQIELADALAVMAKVITSQLDLEEILSRALELAMSLTAAREATIWLVDHQTNELFLEAERGLEDPQIRRMRLPVTDTQAGQVVETGRPLRASRTASGEQVKVKTGYMVEAVLYVPLIHGNLNYGVIAVVHREAGKSFSLRDEKLLAAMADFVAIAIHNARLYQKMADNDRVKGEMIQNISHEFRTPLTYVIGYTGLLLDNDLSSDVREGLEVIARQADKLNRLVTNFVSIETARLDAENHRDLTDMGALLHDVIRSSRLIAVERGISMAAQVGEGLPLIGANELAVSQVLDNLVTNALKFTPDGGQIVLSAQTTADGNEILVTVCDTGIGIPEDAQAHIFERFYQVDGSARRRFGGVGLGLAVCKEIVEAHGGSIWLTSVPDQGTTFYFTLPIA
jgi:signal transduction histidine kinase